MADSSWDNSGLPPRKQGLPTWAKVLLGCGIVFLLLMGGCVVSIWGCANYASKHPKEFEKSVQNFAAQFIQEDWDEARRVVDQLQTDEGAAALYRANPGLAENYATEAAFVAAAREWRPRLEPLPPHVPDMDKGSFSLNKNWNGHVVLRFRNGRGATVSLIWSAPRKEPNRKLVEISVQ